MKSRRRSAAGLLALMALFVLAGCTAMLVGGGGGTGTTAGGSLAATVKTRLIEDPAVRADGIGVSAEGGRVILRGIVGSAAERDQAAYVAAGVTGVSSVENRLVVRMAD